MKTACPHCGQRISYDAQKESFRDVCPSCQKTVVFPAAPEERPPDVASTARYKMLLYLLATIGVLVLLHFLKVF